LRLLLDTHSFLWFLSGDDRLSSTARSVITDPQSRVWISAAGLWEIAIKASLGKLKLRQPFDDLIPRQLALNSIDVLNIEFGHLATVERLPFHHRDPFDRLLAAQSLVEDLSIVSLDPAFDAYGVERIW
jgi:PIN domain nuclease of toxin-antitoxin system